jgi:crossover junction endodeoxyribonuclease RusA
MMLFARVYGVPAPQGSKSFKGTFRRNGRTMGILVESSKKVKPWRQAVTAAVLEANAEAKAHFADAVRLTVQFIMPRTGAEPKGWTRHHTKAPDLSKLIRATEDAITDAAVWTDDSRVVEVVASKATAEPGEPPGCCIVIEALPAKEKPHGKAQAGKHDNHGRGQQAPRRRGKRQAPAPESAGGAQYFA